MTKRRGPMPAPHEEKSIAGPITEQEKRRRMRAIHGADAINAIEGAPISDYAKQLSARWADGEITHGEMVEALIKRHTRVKRSEQSL